jgi:hypothetical protein
MKAYKCTRTDGTDFRTGTVDYAAALLSGEPIVCDEVDPPLKEITGDTCGRGLHLSPTAKLTLNFAERRHRPYRWFEVRYLKQNLVEADERKMRVSRIEKVVAELTLADVFGFDLAQGVADLKAEIETWKLIPWLKPEKVSEKRLRGLFSEWHEAISLWLPKGKKLPKSLRIVRTAADADAAAAADADDADAAAAADDADAADAADDAAAAADAADAAAAADAFYRRYWWRWYVRPQAVLRRHGRRILIRSKDPSPWAPLVEMYRLGALPIGYSKGEFVIYLPEVAT